MKGVIERTLCLPYYYAVVSQSVNVAGIPSKGHWHSCHLRREERKFFLRTYKQLFFHISLLFIGNWKKHVHLIMTSGEASRKSGKAVISLGEREKKTWGQYQHTVTYKMQKGGKGWALSQEERSENPLEFGLTMLPTKDAVVAIRRAQEESVCRYSKRYRP